MPVSKLLQAHFRQILKLEDKATAALFSTYRDARIDLVKQLLALDKEGKGQTFTAQHLALTLLQVDSALRVMWAAQGRDLTSAFREAIATGVRQELDEIVDLEGRFGIEELAARFRAFLPVIPSHTVATLARPLNLLLSRFRDGVHAEVSKGLSLSAALGESVRKAAARLGRTMDAERWKLERIARTEINHAANVGHASTVDQVAQRFPGAGLQKQWSAHLDSRTSRRCHGLHLQIQDTRSEFVAGDGWRGLYPPSHPNCRSRVMPYCARWEATSVKRIADEGAGSAGNPLAASAPTRADIRGARRSNLARGLNPVPEDLPP